MSSDPSAGRPPQRVFAAGGPRELGVQHGRQASALIAETYRMRMRRASQSTSEGAVLAAAAAYVPAVSRFVPELLAEVEGLADGAQMTFEQAFFLQVATEMELAVGEGCSSVGAVLAGQEPFIAQNWDRPRETAGKQIILHLAPDDGPELLMYTIAGVIGYIGMNSAGLGHVNNQLYRASKPIGLTGYFVTRKMLSFSTVPSALDWLGGVEVGSTASYLFGDQHGNLANVELADGRCETVLSPVQAHTNHYRSERWRRGDEGPTRLPDTVSRLARLESLFGESASQDAALGALRDHHGAPYAVCRHDEAPDGIATAASILMRLRSREMLVAEGPPCSTPYVAYGFSREQ